MPTFAFQGRTRSGETVNGDAGRHHGRRGCRAAPRADPRHPDHPGPGSRGRWRRRKVRQKPSPAKNLAVFTRQFSVMIDAGLPLVQCLEILGSQEEDKNFSAVILQTRADVESGASLADAMKSTPKPSTRSSRT